MTGRVVNNSKYDVQEGLNRMEMNVNNFENGIYMILIEQQGELRNSKFVIQH